MVEVPAVFPVTLRHLDMSFNDIFTLPGHLPDSLVTLLVDNCSLREIQRLPASLEVFSCANNGLRLLPVLGPGLKSLRCAGNPLVGLPMFSDPDQRFSDLQLSFRFLQFHNDQVTPHDYRAAFAVYSTTLKVIQHLTRRGIPRDLVKMLYADFLFTRNA